jgi:DNA repair exonuclease SbcCD ATPase subunit
MADTKVYSIRADEEVVSQLKEVTEQFPNASEAFRSLLAAHEMSRAKEVLKGQETSIDDFQAHADALVRAYISSLDLTAGTEQRIRQEFVERLESKDKTIADLQKRTEEAEKTAKDATIAIEETERRAAERDEEANRQVAEYIARAEQAQKDKEQAEKNAQIAEQARLEISGHLDAVRVQIDEALADKKKADARASELEARITEMQKELTQAISELAKEKEAHAADKSAAEIAKAQAETAKIQAISEERERLNAEYKDMQTQMQTKIDKLYEQNSTLQAQIQALRTTE